MGVISCGEYRETIILLKAPLIKDEYNNMEEIVIHVVRINIITYKYHWQHCIKNNIAHIFSTIYDFIINFFQHFFSTFSTQINIFI